MHWFYQLVIACLAIIPFGAVMTAKGRVSAAADLAALAGADAAIGLVSGFPCQLAAKIASKNGATLSGCQVDGVIVTVRVEVRSGGFRVAATATAGPPGSG